MEHGSRECNGNCPRPARVSTTRPTSTTPAASALSPISRASRATPSSSRACRFCDNLTHRGATGADPLHGDGAGILIQMPDAFLRRECGKQGITLPAIGHYGVGMVFLPQRAARRAWPASRRSSAPSTTKARCCSAGATCRPTTRASAKARKAVEPVMRQVFIGRGTSDIDQDAFERKLYIIRKGVGPRDPRARPRARQGVLRAVAVVAHDRLQGHAARRPGGRVLPRPAGSAHGVGARAGAPALLDQHLPDLGPRAPVPHDRAQRRDQHAARQRQLDPRAPAAPSPSTLLGKDLDKLWPLIYDGQSDSASLRQRARTAGDGRLSAGARDDADDSRGLGRQPADGREAPRVLRVPRRADGAVGRPGGGGVHRRPPDRRHARPQRPASGALPRHRRRLVVMASETGVLDIPQRKIVKKWRLQPGKMLLVDLEAGPHRRRRRVEARARRRDRPTANGSTDRRSPGGPARAARRRSRRRCTLLDRQQAFGYTQEDIKVILDADGRRPARRRSARWATTPRWRCCRTGPRPLYAYFKQLFAQVTNPPIDPIREELVMSLVSFIGPRPNLLGSTRPSRRCASRSRSRS